MSFDNYVGVDAYSDSHRVTYDEDGGCLAIVLLGGSLNLKVGSLGLLLLPMFLHKHEKREMKGSSKEFYSL